MISRRRLISLAEAQNWRCAYCAIVMQADDKEAPDAITRDHFVPKCEGGPNHVDNVVVACRDCNNGRGNMAAIKFFYLVQNGFGIRRRRQPRRRLIINAQARAKRVKRFRITADRSIWETVA